MSHLLIVDYPTGEKMYHDDYERLTESVSEQLLLMLWTSVATLTAVSVIMWIAL